MVNGSIWLFLISNSISTGAIIELIFLLYCFCCQMHALKVALPRTFLKPENKYPRKCHFAAIGMKLLLSVTFNVRSSSLCIFKIHDLTFSLNF